MKTAVVICPGRGTYNKEELGYLSRYFKDEHLIKAFDKHRQTKKQITLSELDSAARFTMSKHTRGDNASGLIYAATLGDFLSIDLSEIEVVAVTGNSMGWYSALACAGAVSAKDGFEIANTMGTLMQDALIGGQIIYPFVDENWLPNYDKKEFLLSLVENINRQNDTELHLSIDLGGMLVLAGNEAGIAQFETQVERIQERFPMRLANHAAFHTLMQAPVAQKGRTILNKALFKQPELPLVDGNGTIWYPGSVDMDELYQYTLNEQVVSAYNFTQAVVNSAKEFAPDYFIITGPGTTLGGAVAQSLIVEQWDGLKDKESFKIRQQSDPIIISMGMAEQRECVAK